MSNQKSNAVRWGDIAIPIGKKVHQLNANLVRVLTDDFKFDTPTKV